MEREFIILPSFDKKWNELNLSDEDLRKLQEELTLNSNKGKVIKGTGGLRKIRIAFENKGKSGSARVCYVDFAVYKKIYLIAVFAKKEKENLTESERNTIRKLINQIELELEKRI